MIRYDFDFQNPRRSGPKYVYRLLRENEVPSLGIHAKVSHTNQSVYGHVKYGSKGKNYSHFISTSKSYAALRQFIAHKGKTQVGDVHIRVVKIDLEQARLINTEIEVIDLTNSEERRKHIKLGDRADGQAKAFEEVLLVGNIPATAVSVIYEGPKSDCPLMEPM